MLLALVSGRCPCHTCFCLHQYQGSAPDTPTLACTSVRALPLTHLRSPAPVSGCCPCHTCSRMHQCQGVAPATPALACISVRALPCHIYSYLHQIQGVAPATPTLACPRMCHSLSTLPQNAYGTTTWGCSCTRWRWCALVTWWQQHQCSCKRLACKTASKEPRCLVQHLHYVPVPCNKHLTLDSCSQASTKRLE